MRIVKYDDTIPDQIKNIPVPRTIVDDKTVYAA